MLTHIAEDITNIPSQWSVCTCTVCTVLL